MSSVSYSASSSSESVHPLSWSMLTSAWSEFQLAVLLLPDSPAKKTILPSIEQANHFYHQRDIPAMEQVISQMVEQMKIRLLPLKIKEKASHLLNMLQDDFL